MWVQCNNMVPSLKAEEEGRKRRYRTVTMEEEIGEIQSMREIQLAFAAFKMKEGGYEVKNEVASRSWESLLVTSRKEKGNRTSALKTVRN